MARMARATTLRHCDYGFHHNNKPTIRLAVNARNPMPFPVMLFLLVLSPLFIPIAVTVVDQFSNLRSRRLDRPVRVFKQRAAAARPAFAGAVPAAA
jgi:hypothetical protein